MSQRNETFDIIRALCMLWIVAYWHLADSFCFEKNLGTWGSYITETTMAMFAFMSGFFLGKKNVSAKTFYLTRIKRFYLLLVVSCVSLAVGGWFLSPQQFFFTITGLSSFILPQPKTIWFLSMMIIFYAVTPIILYNIDNNTKNRSLILAVRCCLIFAIIECVGLFRPIDMRVPQNFIFYSIGLIIPFDVMNKILYHRCKLLLISIAVISLSHCFWQKIGVLNIVLLIIGCLVISSLAEILKVIGKTRMCNLFEKISYASLCAYLFHRQIFKVAGNVLRDENGLIAVYYWPVFIVLVLFASFYIQKAPL